MNARGRALRLVLGAIILGALAVWVSLRVEVTSAITHFLPADDHQLGRVARQLADSPLSRTIILSVKGGSTVATLDAARTFTHALGSHPQVKWVESGPSPHAEKAVYDLYFPRRLQLFSDNPARDWPPRLSDEGLNQAARTLIAELQKPTGALTKRFAPEDPLLTFPAILDRLDGARPSELTVLDGQLMTQDGHAIIFLGTVDSPFDSDAMAPLMAHIDAVFEKAQSQTGAPLVLEQSSLARFALASRASIKADVQRITVVSTLGIVLLFVVLFRSFGLLLLALLPLGAGVLAATAATLAFYGSVHGLTLAAGATLIGVCLDYPVHYFNHHLLAPDPKGAEASLRRVWVGLLLGAVTTVTGFAGLAWTDYPGIREMSVFTATGVTGALLTTRFLLPALLPDTPHAVPLLQRVAESLSQLLDRAQSHRRGLLVLPAAALAVGLLGLYGVHFEDDPAALNAVDPVLLAEDATVRARVSPVEPGQLVLALAETEEAALTLNERVATVLAGAARDNLLDGWRSVQPLLWSADLQARNRSAVLAAPKLAERLDAAFTAGGFKPGTFEPFHSTLTAQPAPLLYADLARSPLARWVRAFRLETDGQVGFISYLSGVNAAPELAERLPEGAVYFDRRAFVTDAMGQWRARAVTLVLLGALAVLGLVALRYRGVRRTVLAAAPAFLACLATLGGLSLAGVALTVPHLVALVLVFSMGVDYGVFLAESEGDAVHHAATVTSIVVACASTVLAFGLLAMSSNPALRAMGLTTGVGVLLSMVLAPAIGVLVQVKETP